MAAGARAGQEKGHPGLLRGPENTEETAPTIFQGCTLCLFKKSPFDPIMAETQHLS